VEHLDYQYGNLGPDVFSNTQSVKTDDGVRDMVGAMQVENQRCGCVEE